MIAVLLTILFVAAGSSALTAITVTLRRYGGHVLALRNELAGVGLTRGFAYRVTEHRTVGRGVNVVILPVRKASYRWGAAEDLRAAA
jgi:hypothetical protein